MRAGNLLHRVKFYAKVTTRDDYGASVDSWPVATITTRGEVRYSGGNKQNVNEEITYTKSIELTVRFQDTITETMLIQIDDLNWYIITYIEIIGRNEALRISIEKTDYHIDYWYDYLRPHLDYLWVGTVSGNDLISAIDGRKINITGKDFITDYIPASSTASFELESYPDFIADDTDNLWFTSGVQNEVYASGLYGTDYNRTLIKYNHSVPYDIHSIGILKAGSGLNVSLINNLSRDFELSMFWSGVLNEYGYLKDNRTIP